MTMWFRLLQHYTSMAINCCGVSVALLGALLQRSIYMSVPLFYSYSVTVLKSIDLLVPLLRCSITHAIYLIKLSNPHMGCCTLRATGIKLNRPTCSDTFEALKCLQMESLQNPMTHYTSSSPLIVKDPISYFNSIGWRPFLPVAKVWKMMVVACLVPINIMYQFTESLQVSILTQSRTKNIQRINQ